MKKRNVGIYARYDASEQTWTALYLAKYISAQYRYVKWITPPAASPINPYKGLSYEWDSKVIPYNDCNIKSADYTACVFFEPHPALLKKLSKNIITCFIPDLYRFDKATQIFAHECTHCLVTCEDWASRLEQIYYNNNHTLWHYYPSIQYGIHDKKNNYTIDGLKLFFPVYGLNQPTIDFIKDVITVIKQLQPTMHAVIGSFNKKLKPQAGYDTNIFDWRLHKYIHETDVLIDMNPQPAYAFFPTYAIGHGLQWIGYDTPVNRDPLTATHRHLLPLPDNHEQYTKNDLEKISLQLVNYLINIKQGKIVNNSNKWDIRCRQFIDTTNEKLQLLTS
jgi:hypothetical protein